MTGEKRAGRHAGGAGVGVAVSSIIAPALADAWPPGPAPVRNLLGVESVA